MPIDPDELKVRRVKREQQVQDIQKYMEEQDVHDKENATGKMGHREVKKGFLLEKVFDLLKKIFH
jgi:hypothetical protein